MKSRTLILGHPIHPLIMIFPAGLLLAATVFDIIYFMTDNSIFSLLAFWNITVGIIGGLLAAIPGFIDWRAIPSGTRAKSVGLWHGTGNMVTILLFMIAWLLRLGIPAYAPGGGTFIIQLLGIILLGVTGWLGSELVVRHGVGVDIGTNAPADKTPASQHLQDYAPAPGVFVANAPAARTPASQHLQDYDQTHKVFVADTANANNQALEHLQKYDHTHMVLSAVADDNNQESEQLQDYELAQKALGEAAEANLRALEQLQDYVETQKLSDDPVAMPPAPGHLPESSGDPGDIMPPDIKPPASQHLQDYSGDTGDISPPASQHLQDYDHAQDISSASQTVKPGDMQSEQQDVSITPKTRRRLKQLLPWSSRSVWWLILAEGILAISFGLLMVFLPQSGFIGILISIFLLGDGLYVLYHQFKHLPLELPAAVNMIRGVVGLTAGLLFLLPGVLLIMASTAMTNPGAGGGDFATSLVQNQLQFAALRVLVGVSAIGLLIWAMVRLWEFSLSTDSKARLNHLLFGLAFFVLAILNLLEVMAITSLSLPGGLLFILLGGILIVVALLQRRKDTRNNINSPVNP